MNETHPDKILASEKATPRVFGKVLLVFVDQQRPLIATNSQFAAGELRTHPEPSLVSHGK